MNENTQQLIDQAVDQAVAKTFATLGVDVNDPKSVEEFRADLRFGARLRRSSDHAWKVAVGMVVTGLGIALWQGIHFLLRIKQ